MHILLAEDNTADVALLQELFAEGQQIDMHWVTNGADALDYLHQRGHYPKAPRPDIVILDLGLPKVSGYEVLKELKQAPELKDIPVIVLSTSRNPSDHAQTADLGADMFFSKPGNLEGYENMVDHMVNEDFIRLVKG